MIPTAGKLPSIEEDDLSWFFSPAWQAMEDRADADLKEGRFTVYDTVDEFLASLWTKL